MGDLWSRLTERQKKLIPWLAIALVVGVGLLMLQPSSQLQLNSPPSFQQSVDLSSVAENQSLTDELTAILNLMLGGRRCAVFITMDGGPRLEVAQNVTEEVRSSPEGIVERRLTSSPVILRNDAERREVPLVLQQSEPKVRGVLVVVDAEPNADLHLAISKAVSTALQVPMYRIEVAFKK